MEINVKRPEEEKSESTPDNLLVWVSFACVCVWERERDRDYVRWFTAKKKENTKWGNLFALLVKKWSCWDEAAQAVLAPQAPQHIIKIHISERHFFKNHLWRNINLFMWAQDPIPAQLLTLRWDIDQVREAKIDHMTDLIGQF